MNIDIINEISLNVNEFVEHFINILFVNILPLETIRDRIYMVKLVGLGYHLFFVCVRIKKKFILR